MSIKRYDMVFHPGEDHPEMEEDVLGQYVLQVDHEAEVARLRGLLERARSYIKGEAPAWDYGHLAEEIEAALAAAKPAEPLLAGGVLMNSEGKKCTDCGGRGKFFDTAATSQDRTCPSCWGSGLEPAAPLEQFADPAVTQVPPKPDKQEASNG